MINENVKIWAGLQDYVDSWTKLISGLTVFYRSFKLQEMCVCVLYID